MKKRSRHGFHISRFYAIYLAVTVAVILIIIASLGIVSNRLAEYEGTQPKYVADEAFAKYFGSGIQYDILLDDARYDRDAAGRDEIKEYLVNELGGEELSYSIGSSTVPGEIKYIVRAGSKQFASINLVVSDETSKHGYEMYEFSYIELFLNTVSDETPPDTDPPTSYITVTFDVPSGYSVVVDGLPLSTENIISSHTRTDLFKYYPDGIDGVEYTVYSLTLSEEPPEEVIVTDIEGTQADVTFDADTNTFTSGITYSKSLAEEYSDFVTEAIEGYAAFVQDVPGTSLTKIKNSGYFDLESDAYDDIKAASSSLWMVITPTGNDFENVYIGEFYAYSDTVFACHISFTQILHRSGSEDYPDPVNMYVFLHLTDDGYKIFKWYNA